MRVVGIKFLSLLLSWLACSRDVLYCIDYLGIVSSAAGAPIVAYPYHYLLCHYNQKDNRARKNRYCSGDLFCQIC